MMGMIPYVLIVYIEFHPGVGKIDIGAAVRIKPGPGNESHHYGIGRYRTVYNYLGGGTIFVQIYFPITGSKDNSGKYHVQQRFHNRLKFISVRN